MAGGLAADERVGAVGEAELAQRRGHVAGHRRGVLRPGPALLDDSRGYSKFLGGLVRSALALDSTEEVTTRRCGHVRLLMGVGTPSKQGEVTGKETGKGESLARLRIGAAAEPGRERERLPDSQIREEGRVLRDERQRALRVPEQSPAQRAPSRGGEAGADDIEERGLAAAGGA